MRIVFLGSPDFALPTLRALISSPHHVVGVVTQPDRPSGRGRALTPPPVKDLALDHGVPVFQPERVSDEASVETLRSLGADVFITAAYGQILRQRVLDLPKRGCLNVHASLLPRHRGASPITAAILAGDEVTGVTVMEMVRGLDAGPVVARVEEAIRPDDTAGSLEGRLAEAGAALLMQVLDGWADGRITAVPQDDALATYAPQIERSDAVIDWDQAATDIWRAVRAYNPWPVAHTTYRGGALRVLEAWPLGDAPLTGGAVQTGDGVLALLRVQRSGGKAVGGLEFIRGQRDLVGVVLGR